MLKFIAQCIWWQDIRKPEKISENIIRILYMALELFISWLLIMYLTNFSLNKVVYVILSVYVVLSLLTFGAIRSYLLEISEDKPLFSWGFWVLGWPISLIGLFFLAFNKENILKKTEK
ncbi:hypothetical protein B9N49_06465 [Finegoldia magna]|nr:hypothetical protein [Finegoldia magna]OXZ26952.1 hypothetical protein B9N49_06465 [Finegoldia magna]